MEIKKDIKNDLLKRQELFLEVKADKNPSFDEVRKQISKKVKKPEENINIKKIKGSFGKNVFKVEADIYNHKEDLESIKKLEMTKKQREEAKKSAEENSKSLREKSAEADTASVEEKEDNIEK